MKFTEKLKRLGTGANKSAAARRVGLHASAMSNYVARGSVPRADIALKIARAFNVPLDWLADDAADFPPPPAPHACGCGESANTREMSRLAGALSAADQMELLALAMNLTARQLRQAESQSNAKRK